MVFTLFMVFLSMEKTSRKEQKVTTKMYREMSRKAQTRLEQGPVVAEIVTQELDMLFVSMIMREYLEGPFSRRRALHKGKWKYVSHFLGCGYN